MVPETYAPTSTVMTGSTAPVVVIIRVTGPRVTSAVTYAGGSGRRPQKPYPTAPSVISPRAMAHGRKRPFMRAHDMRSGAPRRFPHPGSTERKSARLTTPAPSGAER